jgi:hypothetical protein
MGRQVQSVLFGCRSYAALARHNALFFFSPFACPSQLALLLLVSSMDICTYRLRATRACRADFESKMVSLLLTVSFVRCTSTAQCTLLLFTFPTAYFASRSLACYCWSAVGSRGRARAAKAYRADFESKMVSDGAGGLALCNGKTCKPLLRTNCMR